MLELKLCLEVNGENGWSELPFSCRLPSHLNVIHDGHLADHAIRMSLCDWSVAQDVFCMKAEG